MGHESIGGYLLEDVLQDLIVHLGSRYELSEDDLWIDHDLYPHDAVLWDLDGPIVDSFTSQYHYFRRLATELDVPFHHTIESFRAAFHEPVVPDLYLALGFDFEGDKERIYARYAEHVRTSAPQLVPGAADIVYAVRDLGYLQGIVTSNTHAAVERALVGTPLEAFPFDVVVALEDLPIENGTSLTKPDPAGLLMAIERLRERGVGHFTYVGDQRSDLEAARAAERMLRVPVDEIAVRYGYDPAVESDFGSDSPAETLRWIDP